VDRPWDLPALAVLAILAIAWGAPSPIAAQPAVLVRADTRIELRVDRRTDGSIHLLGTLRDDLGATLAGVPIDVAAWVDGHEAGGADRWNAHPRTDATGSFDVLFQPEDGWWASASFAGNELYLATEARQRLDLRLEHVSLTVHVEGAGVLDLDRPDHTVRVETTSAVGGADLFISLRNEMGVNLAEGRTDLSGAVTLTVPSDLLGPPSAGRLVALSRADAVRSAAQAEVPIVRLRPTALSLEVVRRGEDTDAPTLRLTGQLTDSVGPRARDAVGLYAGERHLGTAATDETGHYELETPLEELSGLGAEVAVVARFSSDAPWIGVSASPPVLVSFRSPFLDGAGFIALGSLLLVAVALAALFFGRRRPATEESVPELGKTAVILGTRGRARITQVTGEIEDVRSGKKLGGATVRVGGVEGAADELGRFSFEPSSAGRVELEIDAPGYARLSTPITVPHRGEHAGMRIRLVSLRDLALAPLRPIALRLLPASELWSLWTQRELLAALRKAGREPPELGTLIDEVERACYAVEPPKVEQIEAIRSLAEKIEARVPPAQR
jgi:hypothetical protein